MKNIYVSDIEKLGLSELLVDVHSESRLYIKDSVLYKKFYEMPLNTAKRKEKKIDILNEIGNIPHAILPIDKLVKIV